MYDVGFFSLELPAQWVAEQPHAGALLIRSPDGDLALTILAQPRGEAGSIGGVGVTTLVTRSSRPVVAVEAQFELQKWIDSHKRVRIPQAPRLLPNTTYPIATTEGLQRLGAALPWYKRLFLRQSLMGWRYWAMLNSHLLVLISANGRPAALEAYRPIINRMIASLRLPERDLLLGKNFTDTVVSLARSYFPRTAVVAIDEAHLQFGTRHLSIHDLHQRYLSAPEELHTHVRAFLSAVEGDLPASALAGSWAHARQLIMPILVTHTAINNAPGRTIHEEWINGLRLAYVLESSPDAIGEGETHERLITHDDLARWSVTPEELHEQALQNLVLNSHEHTMEGQKSAGYTMLCLAAKNRHNAARLLLPDLHRKLREHLGQTFYVAIPTRYTLLAFAASEAKVLASVRQRITADHARSKEPLSPDLFLVTPDGVAGDPEKLEEIG